MGFKDMGSVRGRGSFTPLVISFVLKCYVDAAQQ